MIVRWLLAALAAGLIAGVLVTPVQYLRVIPLIHAAETFESGGAHGHAHTSLLIAPAMAGSRDGSAEAGTPGLLLAHGPEATLHPAPTAAGRFTGTLLANLVTGAGFALLFAAASLLLHVPVTPANGALWGLAGFAVAALAPSLGLPPELPAMPAADLGARQAWWAATVGLTAAGIYALALRPQPWAKALGVLLLALPHLWGAPRPADLASPIPPTLAAEFAVASLATAAFFWLTLGVLLGAAMERSGAARARAEE